MPRKLYDVENVYTYHPPVGDQTQRYARIRSMAAELAKEIIRLTPPNTREQSLALTNLEQAVFWANASIARNE